MIKYGDTYQTEDKKYECRTGPFEGFFVSSVEFCKIKIDKDDRKVNRTGTQCPPGLAWPTSPQGPNQINSTSIIRRMTIFLPLTDAEALSITTCNSWDTVLSESYSVSNIGNTDVILDLVLPNHDGWLTHAGGPMTDGDSVGIITVVHCSENP